MNLYTYGMKLLLALTAVVLLSSCTPTAKKNVRGVEFGTSVGPPSEGIIVCLIEKDPSTPWHCVTYEEFLPELKRALELEKTTDM